jgi:hypothetical protein
MFFTRNILRIIHLVKIFSVEPGVFQEIVCQFCSGSRNAQHNYKSANHLDARQLKCLYRITKVVESYQCLK